MRVVLFVAASRCLAVGLLFTATCSSAALAQPPVTAAGETTGTVTLDVRETGAGAPSATYTIQLTGPDVERAIAVSANQIAVMTDLPAGPYSVSELDSPDGATVEPSSLVVTPGGSVSVVVTNPYLAGRIMVYRPAELAFPTSCPISIASQEDSANPVNVTIDIAIGESATTAWLPLGAYAISFPGRSGPIVIIGYRLDKDGETRLLTPCHLQDHRPHPVGRIAIDVIEAGSPAGTTYSFTVANIDPPRYGSSGPVNETFLATVTVGQTWVSHFVAAGNYSITPVSPVEQQTIVPNLVALPSLCEGLSGDPDHWCTTDDALTVSVTVTNPTIRSVATSAVSAPTVPEVSAVSEPTVPVARSAPQSPELPRTGAAELVSVATIGIVVALGALLVAASRRPSNR